MSDIKKERIFQPDSVTDSDIQYLQMLAGLHSHQEIAAQINLIIVIDIVKYAVSNPADKYRRDKILCSAKLPSQQVSI